MLSQSDDVLHDIPQFLIMFLRKNKIREKHRSRKHLIEQECRKARVNELTIYDLLQVVSRSKAEETMQIPWTAKRAPV